MACSLRACACVFDAKKADLPCARTTYAPPRICPPQPRFRLAENRNIAPFSARAFLSCPSLDGGVRPSGWGSPQGGPRRICVSKGSWDTNPLAIEEIAMGYGRICHVGRVARMGVRCSARMIARRAFAFEIGRMGMPSALPAPPETLSRVSGFAPLRVSRARPGARARKPFRGFSRRRVGPTMGPRRYPLQQIGRACFDGRV